MSRADSDAIAASVKRMRPGTASNYIVGGMDHLFTIDKKFYDPRVPTILQWMKEHLGSS